MGNWSSRMKEEKKAAEKIFEEIMANELPKFAKPHKFHNQEVQQTSSKIDKTDPHLETLTVKLLKLKKRENLAIREGKMTHLKETTVSLTAEFSKETTEVEGRGTEYLYR